MRYRVLILVTLLLGAIVYSLFPQLFYPTVVSQPFDATEFLQKRNWDSEANRTKYTLGCTNKTKAADCSSLAYLEEKRGWTVEAKRLYGEACAQGDQYGCKRQALLNSAPSPEDKNPIRLRTFSNGLTLVESLDPSAKNFLIAVHVDAGMEDEPEGKTGIAHLVEHQQFKDPKLPAHSTYADTLKEHGGEVNGFTMPGTTLYYASVPSDNAEWAATQFVSMFQPRVALIAQLEKSRAEIVIERSMPYPEVWRFFTNLIWVPPGEKSEMEAHFGIVPFKLNPVEETLSGRRLTVEDVANFKARFYVGRNMQIYLIGNSTFPSIGEQLEKGFAHLAPGERNVGKEAKVRPHPGPAREVTSEIAGLSSSKIEIGSKYQGASAEDELALDLYVEYVAARLMAEVRTVRGETYTAFGTTNPQTFGFAAVHFQTRPELLFTYLQFMRDVFNQEARLGKLTDEQITEAIWIYRNARFTQERSLLQRLGEVQREVYFQRLFDTTDIPSRLLTRLTPQGVRASLQRHFVPENEYVRFSNPLAGIPILALIVLVLLAPFFWFQYRRKDDAEATLHQYHERVRLPGGRWLLMIYLCLQSAVMIGAMVGYACDQIPEVLLSLTQLSLLHAGKILVAALLWSAFVAKLRATAVKDLYVLDDSLILRGRYSDLAAYPVSQISLCEPKRAFHALGPRTLLFFLRHGFLWQKGLVIKLEGKRRYFIPTRFPEQLTRILTESSEKKSRASMRESFGKVA